MAKKMPLSMPEKLKGDLEKMSNEVGLSQNHLAVLALHSLVRNYEKKGTFIFADLLNPEHRD
ncbi:hypothetical protein BME96_18980 (plasmid) [Virgibacillus halodenitrificans]|uniref:Ribbon-helix-helix domain-containing protein n=1 Tax=Virgibacillus halodenitrificans TaxID=1482 RepID=A0AAC9J341_VIRHA|nr:hypothetical protein [Virgibacillus halodenitrificans]APC50368.1 hypothetical protein BME96_18980 [Virgibacillus halodenitrificans]AVD54454.1 hypothetical protein CKF96_02785 [Priestia filamentosa]CDQ37683.1 hypothetical protein BN993_07245 [Virgibacillus halodenitrificans]